VTAPRALAAQCVGGRYAQARNMAEDDRVCNGGRLAAVVHKTEAREPVAGFIVSQEQAQSL
jgi:hypothetical protein